MPEAGDTPAKEPHSSSRQASPRPSPKPPAPPPGAGPRSLSPSDSDTILDETAHFADRDQIFETGDTEISPKRSDGPADDWSGDQEDQIKGERDLDHDAVDELEGVAGITEPYQEPPESHPGVPAGALGERLDLDGMSQKDLLALADALGIAGRETMTKLRLLQAIRGATPPV